MVAPELRLSEKRNPRTIRWLIAPMRQQSCIRHKLLMQKILRYLFGGYGIGNMPFWQTIELVFGISRHYGST